MLNLMNMLSSTLFENAGSIGTYETVEPYEEYLKNSSVDIDEEKFTETPLISIVIEGTNSFLAKSVDSMKKQTYASWELIVAGGNYSYSDSRIRTFADGDIAKAAELASGDFIIFIAAGDVLDENALAVLVHAVCENKDADAFYTDEDVLLGNERTAPVFKPAYSPNTLLSYNFIGRLFMVSKNLYDKCGGIKGFTESDEYDYVLRVCDSAVHIVHVSDVLISRYETPKAFDTELAIDSVNKTLSRRGIEGYAVCGLWTGSVHTHYILNCNRTCEIILYGADTADKLREWLELVEDVTCNRAYHITIASQSVSDTKLIRYENALMNNNAALVMRFPPSESFASMCNKCAFQANADMIVFMSCDVSPVTADWIEALEEIAQRRDIGTVSPIILTPDNCIASAGNVIGLQGWWGVPYYMEKRKFTDTRMNRFINSMRDISISNMDCFMISSEMFFEIGGFDESYHGRAAIAELCMRLMWKYKRNIYTPYARIQGIPEQFSVPDDEDFERSYDVLRKYLKNGDLYYNRAYDPALFTPTVAGLPYQAVKLNPMQRGN